MLNEDVDRYIGLRRTLGYKLRKPHVTCSVRPLCG